MRHKACDSHVLFLFPLVFFHCISFPWLPSSLSLWVKVPSMKGSLTVEVSSIMSLDGKEDNGKTDSCHHDGFFSRRKTRRKHTRRLIGKERKREARPARSTRHDMRAPNLQGNFVNQRYSWGILDVSPKWKRINGSPRFRCRRFKMFLTSTFCMFCTQDSFWSSSPKAAP